jgi:hypothetical protein
MRFPKREVSDSQGSGLFFRLKDGESKKGVLRGELYEFFQVWQNGKSVLVKPTAPGAKSRFRANIVVFDDESGEFKALILEMSQTMCNQLADLAEEYDLTQTKIKITRRGTGTDTVYNIMPLFKEPLGPAAMKLIQSIPLQILEHKTPPQEVLAKGPQTEIFDGDPGPMDDSEIPF